MKGTVKNFANTLSPLTANDYVVLSFIVATFLSVYLMATMMLLLPFYIVFSKQIKLAFPHKKSDWLLLLFALFAALSTFLFSKTGYLGTTPLPNIYLKLLSLGIIILSFDIFFFTRIITQTAFRISLRIIALGSVFSIAVGIIQKIFHIFPDPINRPGRVASLFMNENYFGMVIEFSAVVLLYLIFNAKTNKERYLYTAALALNLVGLWLCQTRMAFIIVPFCVLIFLFFNQKRWFYISLGICFALFFVILLNPSILPRFNSTSDFLSFRLGIWKIALAEIPNCLLLGRGYYSYSVVWTEALGTCFPALHTHNLYLEILLNFGVIGALLLGTFSFFRVKSALKFSIKKKAKPEMALILSACAVILIHGLADTTIFWPQTGMFAVLLLATPRLFASDKGETK